MIRLRPMDDHVIIQWNSEENGPGRLPLGGFEKPRRGTILALGPGRGVRVGDEVLFPRTGGTKVQLDGEDCIIFRESDILAVVVPVAPVPPRHDPATLHPDVSRSSRRPGPGRSTTVARRTIGGVPCRSGSRMPIDPSRPSTLPTSTRKMALLLGLMPPEKPNETYEQQSPR